MIYLDTSVAVAHLLAEDRHPPDALWSHPLASSRLLEYELWTRLHGRGQTLELASYDERLTRAARTLGIPVATL